MLIVDFGLSIAFATILIPALTGLNTALNPTETLKVTPEQATWLGMSIHLNFKFHWFLRLISNSLVFTCLASVTVIFQPLGGILTGFTEPLGRKKALICVNIPYAIAWILLYYAKDLSMIYAAFALLGLGIGLMEAPIFTYIGEIW